MSAHGRNQNEDFSPLMHHEAQQGRRLSASQRNDNRRYNAAVTARNEMLGHLAQRQHPIRRK